MHRLMLLTGLLAATLAMPRCAVAEPSPDCDLVSESRIMNLGDGTKGIGPQQKDALSQASRWALFKVDVKLDRVAYKIGQPMNITFTSPRDCFVLVYYVDATGNAAVVCPSPFSTRNQVKAGVPFKLVDNAGKPLMQTGPPGSEQLQVVGCDRQFDLTRLSGIDAAPATLTALVRPAPTPAPALPKPTPAPRGATPYAEAPPTKAPSHRAPASAPASSHSNAHPSTPSKTPPPTKSSPPSALAKLSAWAVRLVGKPLRVASREDFSKSVEIEMRDHIVETAGEVATHYDKGIGPSTAFDERFKCFAITSVKYDVTP